MQQMGGMGISIGAKREGRVERKCYAPIHLWSFPTDLGIE